MAAIDRWLLYRGGNIIPALFAWDCVAVMDRYVHTYVHIHLIPLVRVVMIG